MLRILAILAMLLTAPAFASECFYRDSVEGDEVHETDDGYDITYSGGVIDHCTVSEKDGYPWADCENKWDGWVVFSGADVNDRTPGEIMVLSYGVYYRVCTTD
jgi:hypothetical protein